MREVLIAVGDHAPWRFQRRRPTMCWCAPQGIGRANHRADVGVVTEILDRHVQGMAAVVDVSDDRLAAQY